MAGPTVDLTVIPTGGAILLGFPDYLVPPSGVATLALSRAVSGVGGLSAFTLLYSGALLMQYLDVGDAEPLPLASGVNYVYRVGDERGVTQTDSISPAWSVLTQPDQLTQIVIRLLQGAVGSMPLPPGYARPQVTTAMPQNGWAAMPFIVINLDLIQQTEVSIGGDIPDPNPGNEWTFYANAKRLWRTSVFCQDAEERDFWRDSLLSVFRVFGSTALSPLGFWVKQSFQAASYTDASEWEGKQPGFYGADLMMEIDGIFPVAVLTGYGSIQHIDTTATGAEGSTPEADTR